VLKGLEQKRTPASVFLFRLFENEITDAAMDSSEAEELFDRLEFLISLEFAYLRLQQVAASERLGVLDANRSIHLEGASRRRLRPARHLRRPAR
jgi:hypothetical protein